MVRHPRCAQVAVVGVPDERLGEVGVAFVVPRPGHDGRPGGARRLVPGSHGQLQGAAVRALRRLAPAHGQRQGAALPPAPAGRVTSWRRCHIPSATSPSSASTTPSRHVGCPATIRRRSRSRRPSVRSTTPVSPWRRRRRGRAAAADAVLELGLGPCTRRPSGLGIPAHRRCRGADHLGECRGRRGPGRRRGRC